MSATGAMYANMAMSSVSPLATGYAQGRALQAAGKYKAGIARTNAEMADEAATQTIEAGDITASRKNLETGQKVGALRAAQGASGVDVGSGSNAMVRNATNFVGALDELTIRNNAAKAAFGYKVQGIQDRSDVSEFTAKSEMEQSLLSAGLKAVSNPLSIYSNYQRYSRYMGGGSGDGGNGGIPDSYLPTGA